MSEAASGQPAEAGIGLVLLAAGASVRMGQPKQLLTYQGRSLLRHAAETALASPCRPVVVVTGELHAQLSREVEDLPVLLVRNEHWAEGMGTSLRQGVAALLAHPVASRLRAVLVQLCDQPLVTPKHLASLCAAHLAGHLPITATAYAGIAGVPAVFEQPLFPALQALPADAGARHLLRARPQDVATVPFAAAALDVDTPAQYQELLQQQK